MRTLLITHCPGNTQTPKITYYQKEGFIWNLKLQLPLLDF